MNAPEQSAENDAPVERACTCHPCRAGFRVIPPASTVGGDS